MSQIQSLCVFCGSQVGEGPTAAVLAAALGQACAVRGIELIQGGGAIGLMGVVADAAKAAGGRVTGIIPDFLERPEIAHQGLDELVIVNSMHARKQRMFAYADAFAVLPGGIGTLDEMVEIVTWKQLRQHDKPVLLVDPENYWAPFQTLIAHIVAHGFAPADTAALYQVVDSVDALFAALSETRMAHLVGDPERL
ncbi:MAG: TIGR00730 family Rossman fold protein [Alphaproteobacteria bacterium]|nr:TIGR00730 family Rossman fold protein [Alphaproteobacteria bacterium]MDP6238746.1 TIGR00730 family Rossman fold protein [Alphaproteobacteria bacterium]MDP7173885.1 TIGR00730 family Rossman fold protein [Alphaproteobacteria bacterium]MDP7487839.1 TIGR00730 family Rossman fold protein [Alphaproteobacteria bacterium]HJN22039.1 TIGR00730 family Rossman fold protein [Alphaproteobacteria bacterium]